MAFKRPSSFTEPASTARKNLKRTPMYVCPVCGDNARIKNYGSTSCQSCKTFFRRHGFHAEKVPLCSYTADCLISLGTRRACTACRFRKCLSVGMSPELIRKEDLSEKRRSTKRSKTSEKSRELSTPRSLHLVASDQSSLTATHWRLLSNVVHAFDTHTSLADIRRLILLRNCPIVSHQQDVRNSLCMITSIYTSLQSFVHCTADFRVMTIGEQSSLFHRNIPGLLAFYWSFVFRESGMFENLTNEQVLIPLFGSENVHHTKSISIRLDHDLTLVKLLLMTLLFSSNCYPVNRKDRIDRDSLLLGTFRLFGSQNVYAELIWRYMLYRYDFRETVRRFDALIKVALDALRLSSYIYQSNELYQNLSDRLAEHSERSLALIDDENAPLWGKKPVE